MGKKYNSVLEMVEDISDPEFTLDFAKQRIEALEAIAMVWRPIETAPKDGTPIIAYQPGGRYPNGSEFPATVGMAHWCEPDGLNPGMWSGPYNPRDYPTHWMPLPNPPEAFIKWEGK